ncbi:MAG: GTP-binding protein [Candidatus Omnitrophota bacterium]
MEKKTIKIVIVGHIDHGKSTLIGRLMLDTKSLPNEKNEEIKKISKELGKDVQLAFLTDQLKEEREKDMTIDTTQISFKTQKNNYAIIDTPGHKEFIKNMLTGASTADAAVLVVDAQEGLMEQTRRHAYLIKLLGIQWVIVAFNKMDLARYQRKRFEVIKAGLTKFLQELPITPFSIIPISAKEGENISRPSLHMKWYKGPSLLQALNRLPLDRKKQIKPLRFCVQDIYQSEKENVVAGKVVSGIIQNGQHVMVLPLLKKTKVNLIKIYGVNKKRSYAGENIGLCLQDSKGLRRGHIIAAENNFPVPVYSFEGNVFWISREPLRINQPFSLRLMTQEVDCVAETIENPINSATLKITKGRTSELKSNQAAKIILKTKRPLVAENFSFIDELGRFVIERENRLQGVGIVSNI